MKLSGDFKIGKLVIPVGEQVVELENVGVKYDNELSAEELQIQKEALQMLPELFKSFVAAISNLESNYALDQEDVAGLAEMLNGFKNSN